MKDEFADSVLEEFIGLRPKMYSTLANTGSKKRAKGLAKPIVKKHIKHVDYFNALFNQSNSKVEMYRLASDFHQMYTLRQTKSGLCCYDDRRYILPNGKNSLVYGHYKIPTII